MHVEITLGKVKLRRPMLVQGAFGRVPLVRPPGPRLLPRPHFRSSCPQAAEKLSKKEYLCLLIEEPGGVEIIKTLQFHENHQVSMTALNIIENYFSEVGDFKWKVASVPPGGPPHRRRPGRCLCCLCKVGDRTGGSSRDLAGVQGLPLRSSFLAPGNGSNPLEVCPVTSGFKYYFFFFLLDSFAGGQ